MENLGKQQRFLIKGNLLADKIGGTALTNEPELRAGFQHSVHYQHIVLWLFLQAVVPSYDGLYSNECLHIIPNYCPRNHVVGFQPLLDQHISISQLNFIPARATATDIRAQHNAQQYGATSALVLFFRQPSRQLNAFTISARDASHISAAQPPIWLRKRVISAVIETGRTIFVRLADAGDRVVSGCNGGRSLDLQQRQKADTPASPTGSKPAISIRVRFQRYDINGLSMKRQQLFRDSSCFNIIISNPLLGAAFWLSGKGNRLWNDSCIGYVQFSLRQIL